MLNISADIAAAERMLSDLARTQLPFATAMAINDTAQAVKETEEKSIDSTFDRPTPFTKRALYLRRASKSKLHAQVGVKSIQAGYLARQVTGGVRTANGGALVVPGAIRLNQYGNMPKGALRRATSRGKVFATSKRGGKTRHLPGGVYERKGRGGNSLKLLAAFEPRATYRKRWQFHSLAMAKARAEFEPAFIARLRQALASAR